MQACWRDAGERNAEFRSLHHHVFDKSVWQLRVRAPCGVEVIAVEPLRPYPLCYLARKLPAGVAARVLDEDGVSGRCGRVRSIRPARVCEFQECAGRRQTQNCLHKTREIVEALRMHVAWHLAAENGPGPVELTASLIVPGAGRTGSVGASLRPSNCD